MNYTILDNNKLTERLKAAEEKLKIYEAGEANNTLFDLVYHILTRRTFLNPDELFFRDIPIDETALGLILKQCGDRAVLEFDTITALMVEQDFNCNQTLFRRLVELQKIKQNTERNL